MAMITRIFIHLVFFCLLSSFDWFFFFFSFSGWFQQVSLETPGQHCEPISRGKCIHSFTCVTFCFPFFFYSRSHANLQINSSKHIKPNFNDLNCYKLGNCTMSNRIDPNLLFHAFLLINCLFANKYYKAFFIYIFRTPTNSNVLFPWLAVLASLLFHNHRTCSLSFKARYDFCFLENTLILSNAKVILASLKWKCLFFNSGPTLPN